MSNYIYKEPRGKRYKLSIKKWNSKFSDNKGRWPFICTVLWVDGDTMIIHHYITIWGKILITLVYPYLVLLGGYKDANTELLAIWSNKTTGYFTSDVCYRSQESWKLIEQLVGEKL